MEITEHILEDARQRLRVLSYGAITADWRVAQGGRAVPVVLGHADARRYLDDSTYMGAIVGRVAGRIGDARFSLGGREYHLSRNDGRHHLHGGTRGLARRNWRLEPDGARALRLTCRLDDGEDGYPGAVDVRVDMRLERGRLTLDMRAQVDRPTPLSLAQHNYYNLAAAGTVWGHRLRVEAARYTETDDELIATGAVRPLPAPLDFRCGKGLEAAQHGAMDLNMVLEEGRDPNWPVAVLSHAGFTLRMWTDQPGLQVYTGGNLPTPGAGICLEPQCWPGAVNHAGFPSPIVTPEQPYAQRLVLEIKAEEGP